MRPRVLACYGLLLGSCLAGCNKAPPVSQRYETIHVTPEEAKASEELKARFLAAYEPAAEILWERYTTNRRVKLRETHYVTDHRGQVKLAGQAEIEFLASDRCILAKRLSVASGGGKWDGEIAQPSKNAAPQWHLLRPDGQFTVLPQKGSQAFVLARMEPGDSHRNACCTDLLASNLAFLGGLTYVSHTFADFIRQPSVTVLSLSECIWNGRKTMRLCYRWDRRTSRGRYEIETRYFDANDHWLLCGNELHTHLHPGRDHTTYQFETRDGVAVPVRIESFRSSSGEEPKLSHCIECLEFGTAHPAPEEFSLKRFGLSEPADPAKNTSGGLAPWFFLIGGGLGLLAFSLSRFGRAHREVAPRNK